MSPTPDGANGFVTSGFCWLGYLLRSSAQQEMRERQLPQADLNILSPSQLA
jgi:hypothetical protein